jgi:hypothetical protein
VSRLGPTALAATADEDEPTVYAIAAALDEASGGSTFVRGLAVGALVGAAIAGSLIRMRIRRRRRRPHQLSRSGPATDALERAQGPEVAVGGDGPASGSAALPADETPTA